MIIELHEDDAKILVETMNQVRVEPSDMSGISAYRMRVTDAIDSAAPDLAAAVERLRGVLTREEWHRIALAGAKANWGKK